MDGEIRSVIVGGDVVPMGEYEMLFSVGNAKAIYGEMLSFFENAHYSIVNLECPLVNESDPIVKTGKNFFAPCSCINGIVNSGIKAVNLSNNHILDQGAKGLISTIDVCKSHSVDFIGAGYNLSDAGNLLIKNLDGVRVAFLGVAENEFSIATNTSPGANPVDLIKIYDLIRSNNKKFDYLIILFHGGVEYYHYPSPGFQRLCRHMIDLGACAVICQHSHYPGTYEWYNGFPIIYGQGNLIANTTARINDIEWYRGFLVELKLSAIGFNVDIDFVGYYQSFGQLGVKVMDFNQFDAFKSDFIARSLILDDFVALSELWEQHCEKEKSKYISLLLDHNKIYTLLERKYSFFSNLLKKQDIVKKINFIRCETHREKLLYILERLLK